MQLLKVEFYKLRHKKIGFMVIVMGLCQLGYMLWASRKITGYLLPQGWRYMFYQFLQLNTMLMPLCIAMIASRLSDIEHKGCTFKYLKTITKSSSIFNVKVICGCMYLMLVVVFQLGIMMIIAKYRDITEIIPIDSLAYYVITVFLVDAILLMLQLNMSLLLPNQMVSFIVAIVGSLIGTSSLFLGKGFAKWVLWGYYGVLSNIELNWERETRIMDLYWTNFKHSQVLIVIILLGILYVVGKQLFIRREQ